MLWSERVRTQKETLRLAGSSLVSSDHTSPTHSATKAVPDDNPASRMERSTTFTHRTAPRRIVARATNRVASIYQNLQVGWLVFHGRGRRSPGATKLAWGKEGKLDSSILGSPRRSGVISEWLVGSKSDRRQSRSIDALINEILTNGLGTLL